MKKQIFSIILVICLCTSVIFNSHISLKNHLVLAAEEANDVVLYAEELIPKNELEVYNSMIALKDNDNYKQGIRWDDDYNPLTGSGPYYWNGGLLNGKRIQAFGCVAFAFMLSDTAFGSLPNRMTTNVKFENVRVGDILRVDGLAHTVIVLQKNDDGIIIAEGNNSHKVEWSRAMSKEEVESADCLITRYPENWVSQDSPDANDPLDANAQGTFGDKNNLTWKLTKSGVLTISGNGEIPDCNPQSDQPWYNYINKIQKIVIEDGITSIGQQAFGAASNETACTALSVSIPNTVKFIGPSAFSRSKIIAANIPGSVQTIDESAFRYCPNLKSATLFEGVKTINQNAFGGCIELESVSLPASIEEVGSGMFFQSNIKYIEFTPRDDDKVVKMGDNIFSSCWYLMAVKLPKKIDKIGDGMFQNCGYLYSVRIPEGAESIGGSAFASCTSLNKIYIPASVSQIGIAAFSKSGLKEVYYAGTAAQWNSISKIGDTASVLSKVTVHYSSTNDDFEPPVEEPTVSTTEYTTENTTNDTIDNTTENTTENSTDSTTENTTNDITDNTTENTTENSTENTTENSTDNTTESTSEDSTESPGFKFGDVDGSKEVAVNDAVLVLQKVLKSDYPLPIQKETDDYMKYADVNGDGKLTALDVALILQKAIKPSFLFPVEVKN